MADQNPVDNVHFFSKWNEHESYPISKRELSMLMPEEFSERYVRVFCRKQEKVAAAEAAFRNYLARFGFRPSDKSGLSLPPSPFSTDEKAPKSMTRTESPPSQKSLFNE